MRFNFKAQEFVMRSPIDANVTGTKNEKCVKVRALFGVLHVRSDCGFLFFFKLIILSKCSV